MIIFYDKKTGEIKGTIEGRIHNDTHLNMWVGSQKDNDRIVVNFKPVKLYNREGKEISKDAKDEQGRSLVFAVDFEPEHEQKDIFVELDKKPNDVYKYKVDLKTKLLIEKS